jgi:hypothetical protein
VPEAAEWSFTDAWLLTAAAGYGRGGCTLTRLIATADALNHDVATEAQAAQSLGRLTASNLLSFERGKFRATESGRAIYKKRSRGWFEQSGSVHLLLSGVPLVEGVWEFEHGEYEAACEAYSRRTR